MLAGHQLRAALMSGPCRDDFTRQASAREPGRSGCCCGAIPLPPPRPERVPIPEEAEARLLQPCEQDEWLGGETRKPDVYGRERHGAAALFGEEACAHRAQPPLALGDAEGDPVPALERGWEP